MYQAARANEYADDVLAGVLGQVDEVIGSWPTIDEITTKEFSLLIYNLYGNREDSSSCEISLSEERDSSIVYVFMCTIFFF